jgi:hypothetical protein
MERIPASERTREKLKALMEGRSEAEDEQLFAARRDLLSSLDLVFMDTTSLYFSCVAARSSGGPSFIASSPDRRL